MAVLIKAGAYKPVFVGDAPSRPISVAEAMRQCRITLDDDDSDGLAEVTALLEGYIDAAIDHLEGWEGIVGQVLRERDVRQDFDGFAQFLRLPLGPVRSITSVTWRDSARAEATVAAENYRLFTASSGISHVRFNDAFAMPADLDEVAAVSVTYTAGPEAMAKPIRQAVLLIVGAWYENREESVIGVPVASLPVAVAVDRLIAPYRRVGV